MISVEIKKLMRVRTGDNGDVSVDFLVKQTAPREFFGFWGQFLTFLWLSHEQFEISFLLNNNYYCRRMGDYASMKSSELKALMTERGIGLEDCLVRGKNGNGKQTNKQQTKEQEVSKQKDGYRDEWLIGKGRLCQAVGCS